MPRLLLTSLAFSASMLLSSWTAFAGSRCEWSHQFELRGSCYEKHGDCSQYNYKGSRVCNNGQDNLQCDYNEQNGVCHREGGYDGSGINPGAPLSGSPSSDSSGHHGGWHH